MTFKLSIPVAVTAAVLSAGAFSVTALANDVVILNGRVIDPETGLDAIRNVAIEDGRISAISEFPLDGDTVVDATGHVVAPGFIDLHAHGVNLGDYRMQVMQGVTTALELELGMLPISDYYEQQAAKNLPINYGAAAAWVYGRIAAFSDTDPLAEGQYFQDAQTRSDWKFDIADDDELKRIMDLVEEGLEQGALGIGVNAGYAPGYGQKEYYALAQLAKKHNVATFTHVRYASNLEPQSSFEAIKELIGNAAITGDILFRHIDHMANVSGGIDHVGFGSDYIPDITFTADGLQTPAGAAIFPDGGYSAKMGEKGVPTPAPYQIVAALVDKLLENGYSEEDCGKFLGGNMYRVIKQVWV